MLVLKRLGQLSRRDDWYSPPMAIEPAGLLGYWCESSPAQYLGFPDPAALVAPDWERKRRADIVSYLRAGTPQAQYMGYSTCRFADCTHRDRSCLGSADLTDGQWIWPEGLWHYVHDHAVRLPDEFVASAAKRNFVIPAKLDARARVFADPAFWLRWCAEHTAPPTPTSDACSLEEASTLCTQLSTRRWRATVSPDLGRWKLELQLEHGAVVDYTAPISLRALQSHLFKTRRPDDEALLPPRRAIETAAEFASGDRRMQPFAGQTADDGRMWWAIVSSGAKPTKRLEELDLAAAQIPEPGWATFLPGNWKIEVVPAMDEVMWRWSLERWRREVIDPPTGDRDDEPDR